jgi:hypothetical protein
MEALMAECVLAARKANVDDTVLASLQQSFPEFDWAQRSAYNLERMTRVFGPDHLNVAQAQWLVGTTLAARVSGGAPASVATEAEAQLRAALETVRSSLGLEHSLIGIYLVPLSQLLVDVDRASEIEEETRVGFEVSKRKRGATHPVTLRLGVELGACAAAAGQFVEAEELLSECRTHLNVALPVGRNDLRRAALNTARLYEGWNRAQPNAERAERAVAWRAKSSDAPTND